MHVIPTLATAGAENFVVSLANEQSKTENVTILTLSEPKESMFLKDQVSSRVKLISLDKKPGMDLFILWKVFQVMKREIPEIVNTHLRSIYYTAGAQILLRKPSFHTIHNMADKEVGSSYRKLLDILTNWFHFKPISISETVRESVTALYGKKHNLLIENGISPPVVTSSLKEVTKELASYRKSESTQILINIGRISKQKNQSMLIKVVDGLINENEDLILLILGDSHDEGENIQALVKSLKHNRIHLLGIKPNVADYLHCSDLFCLSSIHEGLPLTLLEAMGSGTIPVCTPAGGIPDVIQNGVTGFLSKSFLEEDYKKTLMSALRLSNQERLDIINNMKKTFLEHYSISRCSKQYIQTYKSQIETHES